MAIISGLISFLIELLQLFGGRYAEMEDFLINTLGGFSGYIVCTAICERKTNRRKAVVSIVTPVSYTHLDVYKRQRLKKLLEK